MGRPKLKVFVCHSFDKEDADLVDRLLLYLQHPGYRFEIKTAQVPQAFLIDEKIRANVDWANITFGIFTKRFQDKATGRWLAPPYIGNECAFASARYIDLDNKGVHGIVEKEIQHSDLGLITAANPDFPHFARDEVKDHCPTNLHYYFQSLTRRYLDTQSSAAKRPYKQDSVRKTVYVHRNGAGLFKNTVQITITDQSGFAKTGIDHEIWLPHTAGRLPGLDKMAATSISQRLKQPVFNCIVLSRNGHMVGEPMEIIKSRRDSNYIHFQARPPFEVKVKDTIKYQYVWSMPKAFHVFLDQFEPRQLFEEIALRTTHGKIGHATLRVKFEKETSHSIAQELFEAPPQVMQTLSNREDDLRRETYTPGKVYHDAMFHIFEHELTDLEGSALVMRWKPARAQKTGLQNQDQTKVASQKKTADINRRIAGRAIEGEASVKKRV